MGAAASTAELEAATAGWIRAFTRAVEARDVPAVIELFEPDAYWRDVLAMTWDLHTFYGADQIRTALDRSLDEAKIASIRLSSTVRPRRVRRGGREVVEALFDFDTAYGRGRGVVRLIEASSVSVAPKAWTVMTALHELASFDETIGARRAAATSGQRDFRAPNWLDQRTEAARYDDREPTVVVVGAGQAGLAIAARLKQLDIDTLVVDRGGRIGDNWRTRYHSLVLHNEVWANHLPYLPFPETWPTYIPKDLLADWFEAYAQFMELNVWTATELVAAHYDGGTSGWNLSVTRSDASVQVLHPRHVVMAVGVSSIPYRPTIDGLENYAGEVMHSGTFTDGARFAGKSVIVIGTGTSAHDVAQDLWGHGAHVTIVQRSSTTVVSVGPRMAGRAYNTYLEDIPTEVADLISVASPFPVLRRSQQLLTRELAAEDQEMLDGLRSAGMMLDFGEDNTGHQMKYLRRGGGYYMDVGCAQLIIDREIGLLQFTNIDTFTSSGVVLHSGEVLPADAVILATGYLGQQELVRRMFTDEIADRVGPIWGIDNEGEMRNMWRRTAQEGLWFTAGSLAQSRIFSKYLALQIKACEVGLLPPLPPADPTHGTIRAQDIADGISLQG